MADKQSSPSQRGGTGRQTPSRRNDVIRCENCGEDYSVTYKRCPFCDERPGRGGYVRGGKRVANTRGGGYGGPVGPIQIVELVVTLVLIIAAMFIVFRFLRSGLFDKDSGSSSQSSISSSQSGNVSGESSAGLPAGSASGGDVSQPAGAEVQSISLNKDEISLRYNESFQFVATVDPSAVEVPVTWASSDPGILTVDSEGNAVNVNTGAANARVTVTATCGDKTAQCVVYCRSNGGGSEDPGGAQGGSTSPVAPNTTGTIVNAQNGLNIRSGPGTTYDVVASAPNGAKVPILSEENGWYKIVYKGDLQGYVSKDYVSIG